MGFPARRFQQSTALAVMYKHNAGDWGRDELLTKTGQLILE